MPLRPERTDELRAYLVADHWNRLDAHEQLLELERYVPAEALGALVKCPICHRDVRAAETCAACGDEDVEQGEVTRSSVASSARDPVRTLGAAPAERPEDVAG